MNNRKAGLVAIGILTVSSLGYMYLKRVKSRPDTVKGFDISRYVGTWYEVARLDFRFERNLSHVTATYTLNQDGSVKVVNRGYSVPEKKWKTSVGTAKAVNDPARGALKVSFFGPFYSAYNIVMLDEGYRYALVFGRNTDYMWILSRTQTIPEEIKDRFLAYARQKGYDPSLLTWTDQGQDRD